MAQQGEVSSEMRAEDSSARLDNRRFFVQAEERESERAPPPLAIIAASTTWPPSTAGRPPRATDAINRPATPSATIPATQGLAGRWWRAARACGIAVTDPTHIYNPQHAPSLTPHRPRPLNPPYTGATGGRIRREEASARTSAGG